MNEFYTLGTFKCFAFFGMLVTAPVVHNKYFDVGKTSGLPSLSLDLKVIHVITEEEKSLLKKKKPPPPPRKWNNKTQKFFEALGIKAGMKDTVPVCSATK